VVQALIDASCVLDDAFDVFEVVPASSRTLQLFHSRGFVDALQTPGNARLREQYGLIDDCGPFSGVFELAALEAGGSVQAAQLLAGGGYDTAIWWGGGRHHAKTDAAAGFCYVNDVVLAIFELLRTFERVMYIDIDVHHGDGVEEAFCYSDQVLTCSFHHHAPLFFPGSGSLDDQAGTGGKRHIINVPLHAGCSDETFLKVFSHTIRGAAASFVPSVILLQCGADALVGDPLGEFNLTLKSYTGSLEEVRRALPGVPVLLLGGGGYSQYNVARAWATLTYVAAGMTVPDMVPEHEFFEEYSPGYSFALRCSYRPDRNSPAYIQHLCTTIDGALSCIRGKSDADAALQAAREMEEETEDEEN
jgi:acetoin utilization deacetylase AcuC-like enzyme